MRSYALVLAAGAAAVALTAAAPVVGQVTTISLGGQQSATNGAVDRLIQNARHSIRNGQAKLAYSHLDRALSTDPGNAEALMLYVVAYASDNRMGDAQRAFAQLRQTHPSDIDRIGVAQRALETSGKSGVGAGAVAQALGGGADNRIDLARQAASQGRYDEAVRNYRAAFGGKGKAPPPEMAQEFYETLAGTKKGIREARKGLREMYETRRDPISGLAYARVLTYRDSTRRQGIDLLEQLANDPDQRVQAAATDAWGKALTWLGAKKSDLPRFDSYLARYPADSTVVSARAKAAKNIKKATSGRAGKGRRDRYGEARAKGFRLLERGDFDGARERFDYALRGNRRDADSLGGIGVIYLKQGNFREARDYLSRASARSKRARGRWGEALASAEFWATYNDAKAEFENGRLDSAISLARSLPQRGGEDGKAVYQLIGDSNNQLQRYGEAESAFRQALSLAPSDPGAQVGLFTALTKQGRSDEAYALTQQMGAQARAALGNIDGLRVGGWQREAEAAYFNGDDQRAYSLYQQVLAQDGQNPWATLGIARILARNGDAQQAFGLVDGLRQDVGSVGADERLLAAAIFYDEQGRTADAAAIASRVRVENLSQLDNAQAKAREFQNRTSFAAQIDSARAIAEAGGRAQAMRTLETLASRATTPAETAQVAAAMAEAGAANRALTLVRRQISQNGGIASDPVLAVQYAGALALAGQDTEANAILMQLEQQGLDPQQRQNVFKIRSGLALSQADRARKRGAYADAYDLLYPYLAVDSQNADLLGGLARIYSDAGQYREAQTIYAQVLEQQPGNIGALRGAVGAAIGARDIKTASLLLDQAVKAHPTNPEVYYLIGEAARARGDTRTARKAYRTAKHYRQQELAAMAASGNATQDNLAPNPFGNIGAPRGTFASPVNTGFAPNGAVAPVQPNPAANPFDQSSLLEDMIQGGAGDQSMFGDDNGDILLAQAAPGPSATGYQTYGADTRVMQPVARSANDIYKPTSTDVYLPAFVNPAERARTQEETLTDRIDDRLEELDGQSGGHFVQGGVHLRARDGDSGLDQMLEIQTPISYSFAPAELGSITLTATPTYISAGTLANDEGNLRRFGTNPVTNTGSVVNPGSISDSGVGLSVSFDGGWVQVDAGVTPLGFELINPVGGLTFRPRLSEAVTLRFTLEQRAVTDSVLSYAGVKDPQSGVDFGGVVKRGGTIGVEIDTGDFGAYASGGFYIYEGNDVEDNQSVEGNIGAYVRLINRDDEELKIGGNVSFFGYENNLRHFTFRHGGYFSPQSYFSVSAPVEYTRREGPMSYQIGGSIGIQRFDEDNADIFPGNAQNTALLFRKLNATIAGGTVNLLGASALTSHAGQEETSIAFSGYTRMEYAVSDRTTVGAGARIDGAADWFEGTAFLFLRQSLGGKLYSE